MELMPDKKVQELYNKLYLAGDTKQCLKVLIDEVITELKELDRNEHVPDYVLMDWEEAKKITESL